MMPNQACYAEAAIHARMGTRGRCHKGDLIPKVTIVTSFGYYRLLIFGGKALY